MVPGIFILWNILWALAGALYVPQYWLKPGFTFFKQAKKNKCNKQTTNTCSKQITNKFNKQTGNKHKQRKHFDALVPADISGRVEWRQSKWFFWLTFNWNPSTIQFIFKGMEQVIVHLGSQIYQPWTNMKFHGGVAVESPPRWRLHPTSLDFMAELRCMYNSNLFCLNSPHSGQHTTLQYIMLHHFKMQCTAPCTWCPIHFSCRPLRR